MGSPKRSIGPSSRAASAPGRSPSRSRRTIHRPTSTDGRRDVVADEQPERPLLAADDEPQRQPDGQDDVGQRGRQVGAGALVHPQQRVGELEVREGPQPERRGAQLGRALRAEQQLRQRARRQRRRARARGGQPEQHAGGGPREPAAAVRVGVEVVEAHERLADPEPHHDREQDHRRDQQLGGAVVGAREVAGVDRQQAERDHLGDHVGELVGGARAQQPPEVAGHSPADGSGGPGGPSAASR